MRVPPSAEVSSAYARQRPTTWPEWCRTRCILQCGSGLCTKTVLDCPDRDLRARVQAQFVQDVGNMPMCRAVADHQRLGDCAIAEPPCDQRRHFALADCKSIHRFRGIGRADADGLVVERLRYCLIERQ